VVIGSRMARALGISGQAELDLVGLGTRAAKVGMAETVEIGPVTYRKCPVAYVEGRIVEGADGVIPLALFSAFRMRLDLSARKLSLIPYPEGRGAAARRGGGRNEMLLVKAVVNRKHEGYAVLDTGAYCSAVSRQVAGALRGSQVLADLPVGAGTGVATGQIISAAVSFEVAGLEIVPDRILSLDLRDLSQHNGLDVVGVLGFPALNNYVLNVDYRNQQVALEPAEPASRRERHDTFQDGTLPQLAFH